MAISEPTFLILSALAGASLHGYGLVKQVHTLSGGRVRLSVGSLYRSIDRLTEEGQVELEREEVVDGRLRRYYRLTDAGAAVLAAEAGQLRHNADLATAQLRIRSGQRPGLASAS